MIDNPLFKNWKYERLKWVCSFKYGNSLAAEDRESGEVPVYGSNGIVGYHSQSITKKPCLIIGRKGSFGKLNFSSVECFPIDTTYFVDETSTANNIKWLFYSLQTLKLDELSKDTGVPGLSREEAYEKRIHIPPNDEQLAIANYLDTETTQIDDIIAKKEKLIELLHEERGAIIYKAVTKGLNPNAKMKPSGIEWLGEIPEHWEIKKVKYVAQSIQTGVTPPTVKDEYYADEIAWFTPSDFGESFELPDSKRKISRLAIEDGVAKLFPVNSVLLVAIGATLGKVGYISSPASSNQQINAILFDSAVKAKFYAYYLFAIQAQVVAMTNASTLAILNQADTKAIPLTCPMRTIGEIDTIVEFIEAQENRINHTISRIEKEIELLQEYRTVLINEVVTGKTKVS